MGKLPRRDEILVHRKNNTVRPEGKSRHPRETKKHMRGIMGANSSDGKKRKTRKRKIWCRYNCRTNVNRPKLTSGQTKGEGGSKKSQKHTKAGRKSRVPGKIKRTLSIRTVERYKKGDLKSGGKRPKFPEKKKKAAKPRTAT